MLRTLGLSHTTVLQQRAEELKNPLARAEFDVVISRAVAHLKKLIPLGAPLVREGGYLLAMKGERAEEELVESKEMLNSFSLVIEKKVSFFLPLVGSKRCLIFMMKT